MPYDPDTDPFRNEPSDRFELDDFTILALFASVSVTVLVFFVLGLLCEMPLFTAAFRML